MRDDNSLNWYNFLMKKIKINEYIANPNGLEDLLRLRRQNKITPEQMQDLLEMLVYDTTYVFSYFPRGAVKDEIIPEDIQVAKTLMAEGNKKLFPMFTSFQKIDEDITPIMDHEVFYRADMKEMLTILMHLSLADALVINPGTDDFVLDRKFLKSILFTSSTIPS